MIVGNFLLIWLSMVAISCYLFVGLLCATIIAQKTSLMTSGDLWKISSKSRLIKFGEFIRPGYPLRRYWRSWVFLFTLWPIAQAWVRASPGGPGGRESLPTKTRKVDKKTTPRRKVA